MVQFDVKRVTNGAESFMVSFDLSKTPITQVADYIIIAAAKNKTSDIHFDPRDEGMMVRFRIDGDCQDYTFIPKAYEKNLTTRLKLLANMNITETRLPQDGAIKGEFGGQYLDMRVACLPTNQGEKIVIRILDYSRSLQGIDSLGFHPKNLEKIKRMMGVPNGIILVTGATGSGKSTTTYSMLSGLNKPEVNVITVEDPVEMNIEGINQVQVNSEIGMTFAAALRSILREDPNVILIGEIRDSETAQIAVRASITGHLVMSTLHTNNALATVERLLDMDVERYLLSTALTGIVSQRLAKQLCPDCRYQRETTPYEKKVYKRFLHQDVQAIWDANPKGCDNCRKGYRGRIAVHEVLELDDHIRNALNDEKLSKDDFAKMIYTGKTITMLQDALIKALEGQTSFEEVYRTIEIENEDEDNYAEEISEAVEKENEEENAVNLPTGDNLLEEDIKQINNSLPTSNETPLNQPTEQLTATPETSDTNTANQVEPPLQPDLSEISSLPEEQIEKSETALQPNQISEPIPDTSEVKPQPTQKEPQTTIISPQQPTVILPQGPDEIKNAPPLTPTIELEPEKPVEAEEEKQLNTMGYKIVMPDENPDEQETTEEQTSNSQTLTPTIDKEPEKLDETKEEKPSDTIGYKIAMPDENPIEVKVEEKPKTEQLIEQPLTPTTPLVPTAPIQEEYTISAGSLDDDAQTKTQSNSLQGITIPSISPTQVQQMNSPLYVTNSNNNEFAAPSFATNSNPTDMAFQFQQPISPMDSPLQNFQAVSIIPSTSEQTQEATTGAEVLNDPGIRIAENNSAPQQPIIPTII